MAGNASNVFSVGCIKTSDPPLTFFVALLYINVLFLSRQSMVSYVHIIVAQPNACAASIVALLNAPLGGANSLILYPKYTLTKSLHALISSKFCS